MKFMRKLGQNREQIGINQWVRRRVAFTYPKKFKSGWKRMEKKNDEEHRKMSKSLKSRLLRRAS